MIARLSTLAIALFTLWIVVGVSQSASAATVIKTQAPCAPDPVQCETIVDQGVIPTIRKINFNAPGRGVAMVQFHGSAQCENAGASPGIVILQSQIVDDAAATPDGTGPGGLWQGVQMLPAAGLVRGRDSFNFSSTRTFVIP
jgi:hypothetical protein